LANATVNIGAGLATATTDALGNFATSVPAKDGSQVNVTVLVEGRIVYNNQRTLSAETPLLIPVP
jgi:hypothetical protein